MLVTNSSCFSEGAAQLPHQQVNDELSWLREASTALVPGDYLPSHDAAADFDVAGSVNFTEHLSAAMIDDASSSAARQGMDGTRISQPFAWLPRF
jgi:hypothetical protein